MSLGRVTRERAGLERILEASASLRKSAGLLPAALTMDEDAVPARESAEAGVRRLARGLDVGAAGAAGGWWGSGTETGGGKR